MRRGNPMKIALGSLWDAGLHRVWSLLRVAALM